ncbi:MAG TPA: hypothetical protein VK447_13360 [Myxococcaceae bacterium]|nr:hypothetical protein [Myxococcaceae bacterium]
MRLHPAHPSEELRRKLEHRAELLDATLLRYRALEGVLRGFFWKEKLRRNGELVRQVAESQPEVDPALESALRRAEVEGWDPRDPTTRCLREVAELRERLAELVTRRLQLDGAELPLAELWSRLEALQAGPRRILPGQRWATAVEVLPRNLPELLRAGASGDLLEQLFKRPMDAKGPVPLGPEEVESLRQALPQADAALQALWRRVHGCDPSGSLLRFLQKRSRRAPVRPPQTGPEELLRVAFWYDVAHARLREVAELRLSPVQLQDAELVEVVAWLARYDRDPNVRLLPSELIPPDRVALLELAHELWNGRKGESQGFRLGGGGVAQAKAPPIHWDRLRERAWRVDQGAPSEDVERVRDVLRLFVRIRERAVQTSDSQRPPEPRGLEALVLRARELSGPKAG